MSNENGHREREWHCVLAADDLPEGRVTTVHAGLKEIALVHYEGKWAALDNRCPHQGGPLGEGSIENGLLSCPGPATSTSRSPERRGPPLRCPGEGTPSGNGNRWIAMDDDR
jgi:hypothetical protein